MIYAKIRNWPHDPYVYFMGLSEESEYRSIIIDKTESLDPDIKYHAQSILAEEGFIPISETFFYKPD